MSGRVKALRTDRADEKPIELLAVSKHGSVSLSSTDVDNDDNRIGTIAVLQISFIRIDLYRQYFIVAFKEQPFELWDLKNLTLLSTVSQNFKNITCLEWSPKSALKRKHRLFDISAIFIHSEG